MAQSAAPDTDRTLFRAPPPGQGRVNSAHDAAQDFSLDTPGDIVGLEIQVFGILGALVGGFDPARMLEKRNE
jgi:hypothetical protein